MAGASTCTPPSWPTTVGNDRATPCKPSAPCCSRETVSSRRSPRNRLRNRLAVTRPIAWLVAPLRRITSWAAVRTAVAMRGSLPASQPGQSRRATPPTRAPDHSTTSESPCSPTTWACTELVARFNCKPSIWRRRAVSSRVPVPSTRSGGRPLASVITCVSTSTGLVTSTTMPPKPANVRPMSATTRALSRNRSSRDSPGLPPRPAATTTTWADRICAIGVACTLHRG